MKFVKVLIWLGFSALLLVSVPKIAWVFRLYEGPGTAYITLAGFSFDALWLIPLFVAICIDALTLALTYAVSIDKARASQCSMWAFVGLLCGLSYYCNLLYNDVPLRSNPFIVATTPFILAGVPLFALCYTLILSRVGNQGETLAEKAARLESEKDARKRIAAARQGRLTAHINNVITGAGDIAKHAGKTLASTRNDTGPDVHATPAGHSPDVQAIQNGHSEDTGRDIDAIQGRILNGHRPDIEADTAPDIDGIEQEEVEPTQARTTSRVYLPLEDAAARYGYSVSYLTKLAQSGKVKTQRNDKTRLLESSLQTYVTKSGRKTLELPIVKVGRK